MGPKAIEARKHPLLGKISDQELAKLLGCCPAIVRLARRRAGIPRPKRAANPQRAGRGGRSLKARVLEFRDAFGVVSDVQLAEIIGDVSAKTIRKYRRELGIEPGGTPRKREIGLSWLADPEREYTGRYLGSPEPEAIERLLRSSGAAF